jgi:serine/threonine protein kinase
MQCRFGPYRLLQPIGTGGMGEVWSAVHLELNMPCAIKLMKPDLQCAEDRRTYERMFLNEASICAQLRHGNIVRVHNAGFMEGRLFIAMDLVDGVNLRSLVRMLVSRSAGPLPLALVAHVVTEVLEALDYAHNRTIGEQEGGVIHGDISPANIMLSSHGEVLLTDFGLARFVSSSSSSRLVIGTPAYMAPEVTKGRGYRASDLYSVGAILHELLSGQPPVARNATLSTLAMLPRRSVPRTGREDVPEPIETLRSGLLEPEIDRRIASTQHALAIMERLPSHPGRSGELRELYREHFGRPHSGLTLLELPRVGSKPAEVPDPALEPTRPLEAASAASG